MNKDNNYRLALDINTSAIGLATYILDAENQPIELAHVDVRVFGEPLADEKTGKVKKTLRREKRLLRRQTQRRSQRLKKIAHLFPLVEVDSDAVRKEQKHQREGGVHAWRAKAATEKIALARLMAVFLLMAKNRGYEGRFTKGETVKDYICEVKSLMKKKKCDTLGQLLYKLKLKKDSPNRASIRAWKKISKTGTYTYRKTLKEEFDTIWKTQEEHHPSLKRTMQNDERIADLYKRYFATDKKSGVKSILPRPKDGDVSLYDLFRMALFDQRPIWWDLETVGKCDLEDCPRAPKAHPVFQTYRIEQQLNDLELKRSKRKLTDDEKEKLRPLFNKQKTVSASKIYTTLDIKKDRFTHDRSKQHGEKSHEFLGNKTKVVTDSLEKKAEMSLSEREREVLINSLQM